VTNYQIPKAENEPIKSYMPGSPELVELQAELERQKNTVVDIPLIIGGQRIFTESKGEIRIPHKKDHKLATFSQASTDHLDQAIAAAAAAKEEWENMAWQDRMAIFLKAADLLAGPWRAVLNAATMLGQSKNVFQAEIDAACELIDFWRFNPYYAKQIYGVQPDSSPGIWNRSEYRALEGFVRIHSCALYILHHGDPRRGRYASRCDQFHTRSWICCGSLPPAPQGYGWCSFHRIHRSVPGHVEDCG
jgi:1-pyrroline-5-carboxylate dehydrogenase